MDSGLRRNDGRSSPRPHLRHPGEGRGPYLKIDHNDRYAAHTLRINKLMSPCVYLLASKKHGTLYVGVTSDLIKRIWEHKNNVVAGFTQRYGVHTLVWFEQHETMESAIQRERAIKEWKRAWKIRLIEEQNPQWRDLYPELI